MLRSTARAILPPRVRQRVGVLARQVRAWKTALHLARWRRKVAALGPDSSVRCLGYTVRLNDGPNFYVLYKDLIVKQIYQFQALRPDPFILDCGSNIGVSILYFKRLYPKARIIGFEPDPTVVRVLEENVRVNKLADVQIVQAAIGGSEGSMTFYSDGKYGSSLAHLMPDDIPEGWTAHNVPCVRLRDYLSGPVDFMKMNIEGAEWEALADSEDRLRLIHEMVIEYHHLPGLPRTLHRILEILDRQGFEYLINDFDPETNASVQPPFQIAPTTTYFLLIYARRMA